MNFEIYSIIATFITNMMECTVYHMTLEVKYKKGYSWIFYTISTLLQEIYVIAVGRNTFQVIISNLILVFFVLFFFKNSIKEKILVFIYIYSIALIIDFSCSIILFSVDKTKTVNLILVYILFVFMYISFSLLFAKVWRSIEKIGLNKRIIFTLLFPIWVVLISKLLVFIFYKDIISAGMQSTDFNSLTTAKLNINIFFSSLIIVSDIMFLIVYIVIFLSIIKEAKKVKLNHEMTVLKMQNELAYTYYKTINQKYNEARKYKHDINNIISIINLINKTNKVDSLNIIKQLKKSIGKIGINNIGA